MLQTTSVIGEIHHLNLINELLLFLFKFFSSMLDISIHGRKNKNCATKTLFTNFTRGNFFPKYGRICSLFEEDEITCKILNFCELNMKTRSEIFAYSFPLSSLVVYCLYCSLNVLFLHDTTQCYKQITTLFQPYFVVRSQSVSSSPHCMYGNTPIE